MAKAFDVWFISANTVYRAVPYHVVADWVQGGRLGQADRLRAAGTEEPWKTVAEFPLFADFTPASTAPPGLVLEQTPAGEPVHLPEPPEEEALMTGRRRGEEDDEVDMIPLIDISMVLLVFFIMVSAAGALSPVDVPDMHYGGELHNDPQAITISIEKASAEDVHYSVRVGSTAAKKEHSKLENPEAALAALDSILSERTQPPEVRIACEKDLPSERVIELSKELKKRLEARKINSFVATVNEAPKK